MAQNNVMHDMTVENFGDQKLSKRRELNDTMSIAPTAQDSYEQKLFNLNGGEE